MTDTADRVARPQMTAKAATPCIGICSLDAATGVCEGCLRNLGEIARWSSMQEPERQAVMAGLAPRRALLGR